MTASGRSVLGLGTGQDRTGQDRTALGRSVLGLGTGQDRTGPHEGDQSWVSGQDRTG